MTHLPANPINFPEAYTRFWPSLRAKCQRLLGPTAAAEDLAQEAFLRLWQSGPPLDGDTPANTVLAWLYVTCTRLAIDALRKGRWLVAEADERPPTPCCASPLELVTARSQIAALCGHIASEELEIALLARVDGLRQREVAQLLHISERSVRRRLESFDQHCAQLREDLT